MKKIVTVSGGFDPIHIGHVRMFEEAKALGDELVVILNNDNWLMYKKGFVFMPQDERKEVIEAFECVDKVIFTEHEEGTDDLSICKELKKIQPHVFGNGGDRKAGNIPEYEICRELECEMVFNLGVGGKVQSSSELVEAAKRSKKRAKIGI